MPYFVGGTFECLAVITDTRCALAIKINKCRQEWRTFHFHFRFQIQMTVISWELLFVRNGCFPGNFKVIAAMAKGFGNFKYPLYESKSNHLQCA